ncbi:MAG: aspartate aminotransferase family protein [Steroidobacteraceae bacterium]
MTLHERDARVIGNIARLRFSPLCLVGGRGNRLIEEGGRELLDLGASFGPAIIGHSHPAIIEAVTKAVSSMAGASLSAYPNENAVALAEELLRITPGKGERRIWFGHSGSDANDTAMRIVTAATGRPRIISFIGSWHGGLSGSGSISGHSSHTHTLPRPGLLLLPYPDPYRGNFSAEEVLKYLDYQFATVFPPKQVAGVFIEPILDDGGLVVPPPGFLAALQERCKRHGIQIIVDEVKVGLARSGKMHCFEYEGLEPDLVVFGKALGGGLPLSAVVGPQHIMDYATAYAIQTMGGNSVVTASGRAVLRAIADEGLIERANRVGAILEKGLHALMQKHEIIGEVRGRGMALGIDLVQDRATRQPVPVKTTAKVIFRAYQLGAVFFYVGLGGNVLEFTPPLTLTETEAAEGLGIIDQALTDVAKGMVSDAAVAPFIMW